MEVTILGSGASVPSPDRVLAGVMVETAGEPVIFDIGAGVLHRLTVSLPDMTRIEHIFITHFHGDHFLGLPGLIQSMSMNDRDRPLHVYGPSGMKSLLQTLVTLGYFAPGFAIGVTEMGGGSSVEFDEYTVSAMEAKHTVPGLSFCLQEKLRPGRFDKPKALELGIPEGPLFGRLQDGETVTWNGKTYAPEMVMGPPRRGRKVVYTGDTLVHPQLAEFARDCDVLIHDATADAAMPVGTRESSARFADSSSHPSAITAAAAEPW